MRIFRKLRAPSFCVRMRRTHQLPLAMNTCSHLVEFFRAGERLIERVAEFLHQGFDAGCVCIAVVTSSHRAGIDRALARRGLHSDDLIADYRYIVLDAREALRSIRRDGRFDAAEFHRSFGQLITLAAAGGRPVCIVGEMVALLVEQGETEAAIELEEMWNEMSRIHPFTLLCMYPDEPFKSANGKQDRLRVTTLHNRASDQV
jgi:hypothetical protein